ncbi:hypothetical protein [Mucilaginibacter psychrotolerans]|uniref:DUF3300 domain-containing protein n=1 Tax=Mucilaginibacter psychrotolerans TaxID=1524096 RepID=A0A4Y8SEL7_9SPHI|nr:hypothetical protein [Mucilaginibacter psychrotolerans]TFF37328.1 hypothetical protein E2R66_12915 [Mucilaginibacter psychrotolerans]
MKKIILGMLAVCFFTAASVTPSQAQVSLNINIGTWTPPAEYADAQYVYLPDVESYYYVPKQQYVYMDGGQWVWRNSLPPRYANYNINNGYKVIVNRPQAYRYFNTDRTRYARYRGSNKQVVVRGNSYAAHKKNYVRKTTVVRTNNGGPGRGPGNGHAPGGNKGHGGGHGPGGDKGHGGGHGKH